MHDVRAPWLILYGVATLGVFMIALGILETAFELTRIHVPAPDPYLGDDQVWQVLDEARRITEQAAGGES